ncbi:hypothetical protein DV495_002863 [Geotrichum candidum]|nr:hypothetical protein DV495_002863 [Geotrichum candidum]
MDPETEEAREVVIADSYYNSVKSLKGKIFLMGNYEFVVGTVSNWADRILDTMDLGDYVGAIDLATEYYQGTQDLMIVGLPADDDERKSIVVKNLPEMIMASIKYTFNAPRTPEDQWIQLLRDLCDSTFRAWTTIGKSDDLMEEIFESFENAGFTILFFEELANFILDGCITYLPPRIFRELVKTYIVTPELQNRLEELICSLDIQSLDLDMAISLCTEYHLKDTLIYIWNHALNDFITPLWDLFELIKKGDYEGDRVFPYISYILTGRIYPTGMPFSTADKAFKARSYVYYLLFSSTNIVWPRGGSTLLTRPNGEEEPAYPYLWTLITFDCAAFFSALNEAFEDSFLNDLDSKNKTGYTDEALVFGNTITRQLIINILLDLFNMSPELQEKRIFLDIFIARNYPKYSQFIILPGNILSKVLEEVCLCQDPDLKEECQLGVEALLSKYKPYDLDNTIALLHEVKYYHVLQYIFRSEKRYSKLLETTLKMWKEDPIDSLPEDSKLLDTIAECFRNTKEATGLQEKERSIIDSTIIDNFEYLLNINTPRLVKIISKYSPHLHETIFKLESRTDLQFNYFESLFALARNKSGIYPIPTLRYRHLYIKLLAKRQLNRDIYSLLTDLITGAYDVDLKVLRNDLQEAGAVDSIILILIRQREYTEAIDCVVERLYTLDKNIFDAPEEFVIPDIRKEFSKYLEIGVGICSSPDVKTTSLAKNSESKLKSLSEKLWVKLIDALVDISKGNPGEVDSTVAKDQEEFTRNLLLKTLSALLDNAGNGTQHDATIVRICSSLMTPLDKSKPRTIGTVRPILTDLFSAYRYQQKVLTVAKQLLDKDAYENLQVLMAKKLEGWRASKSGECEGCGKRILGLGIDADWLYEQWGQLQVKRLETRPQERVVLSSKEHQFLAFVNASPSPYHAVSVTKALLAKAGFTEISERTNWSEAGLQRGQKYFLTRNGSSIIAFGVGGKWQPGNGISIVGAHTDSPCLRVKPVSKKTAGKGGYVQVGVETYGGGLWHTWFDRDLSVAGRIIVKEGTRFVPKLVNINKPLLRIPTLAIHLNRGSADKFEFNKETQLVPIAGLVEKALNKKSAAAEKAEKQETDDEGEAEFDAFAPVAKRHEKSLVDLIAEDANVKAEDIEDFELVLYDTQPSVLGGLNDEFVFSPRHDNLNSSFTTIKGLIESLDNLADDEGIRLAALFDHEEIGSASAQGADSNLLLAVLTRLAETQFAGAEATSPGNSTAFETFSKSFLISADMAHAIHPNYESKHESNHAPAINAGPVIKINANQRYATNSVGTVLLKTVATAARVPLQLFVVRNDSACGSTIGPILASKLGIRTLDIGSPQLSMHSIRETAGTDDIGYSVQLFKEFYRTYTEVEKKVIVDAI